MQSKCFTVVTFTHACNKDNQIQNVSMWLLSVCKNKIAKDKLLIEITVCFYLFVCLFNYWNYILDKDTFFHVNSCLFESNLK